MTFIIHNLNPLSYANEEIVLIDNCPQITALSHHSSEKRIMHYAPPALLVSELSRGGKKNLPAEEQYTRNRAPLLTTLAV